MKIDLYIKSFLTQPKQQHRATQNCLQKRVKFNKHS
jgi:hypothetical protein